VFVPVLVLDRDGCQPAVRLGGRALFLDPRAKTGEFPDDRLVSDVDDALVVEGNANWQQQCPHGVAEGTAPPA